MIPFKELVKQSFKYYVYGITTKSKKNNWKRHRRSK